MNQPVAGVIGLGLVGAAIARRLGAAGWRTVGYDTRCEAVESFCVSGGTAAGSAAQVGREADCVVLAVFDTGDVIQIVETPDGLLAPGHRVRWIVDCSTGNPELLEPLAARLKAWNVDFIEAPLSGSSTQIAAGDATLLLGGDARAIAQCDALLQAIASKRIHVGAAGMGAKAKLATNLVLGLNRAVLAEGMVFAEALGVAPDRFLQLVLATPARSAAAETKGEMMVRGDFTAQSRIRQHLKDVDLMLSSASTAGIALPFSETHAHLMRAAVAAGDGDLDNAAIIRQIRRGRNKQDGAG